MLHQNPFLATTADPEQEACTPFSALERRIDEALIESFPASDAPYWTLGTEAVSAAREFGSPDRDIGGGPDERSEPRVARDQCLGAWSAPTSSD